MTWWESRTPPGFFFQACSRRPFFLSCVRVSRLARLSESRLVGVGALPWTSSGRESLQACSRRPFFVLGPGFTTRASLGIAARWGRGVALDVVGKVYRPAHAGFFLSCVRVSRLARLSDRNGSATRRRSFLTRLWGVAACRWALRRARFGAALFAVGSLALVWGGGWGARPLWAGWSMGRKFCFWRRRSRLNPVGSLEAVVPLAVLAGWSRSGGPNRALILRDVSRFTVGFAATLFVVCAAVGGAPSAPVGSPSFSRLLWWCGAGKWSGGDGVATLE